jgi:hypothetical protein
MLKPELTEQNTNYILRLLIFLLEKDFVTHIGKVWRLIREGFWAQSQEGMYEVLEYESLLDLQDARGEVSVFHKRQKVRFRQNNIIAFQDQAWGDGDIFAQYKCSPGYPVDRYREGHRYRILISLRQAKRRGDIEEFRIERTVRHGFKNTTETFQTEVDHKTRSLSCGITFPLDRPPKSVNLIKQNLQRSTPVGPDDWSTLPDGRIQVTWKTRNPHIFEKYVLRWEW